MQEAGGIKVKEMAPKGDGRQHLLNVGREGFAALDDFFGAPRRVPPPPSLHNRPVLPPKEAVLNSLEAAEIYGGMVFVDYRKGKPAPLRKVYY